MKGKDAKFTAYLQLAKCGGFAFAESAQLTGAALDDGVGHLVGKRSGFGTGTLGIRKNVEIGERERLDEGQRRGVVLFRLTWETSDNVGADGGMRKPFADEFDAARVMSSAVPAVHGGKDAV